MCNELLCLFPEIESLFVSYSKGNTKRLIGFFYRPPSGNFPLFIEKLTHFVDIIDLNYRGFQIVIMGDLNFDLFKMKDDTRVIEYYTTMVGALLFPMILRPTRSCLMLMILSSTLFGLILLIKMWPLELFSVIPVIIMPCLRIFHRIHTRKMEKKRFPDVGILRRLMPVVELSLVPLIRTICVI